MCDLTKIVVEVQDTTGRVLNAEIKQKERINLIICLEENAYNGLVDTSQNLWKIELLQDFTQIETIFEKYIEFDILNLGLCHHGNRYCPGGTLPAGQMRLIWSTSLEKDYLSNFEEDVLEALENENKEYTMQNYLDKYEEILLTRYTPESVENMKATVIIKYYLKIVLDNIVDGGNYFSLACDEADNSDFLDVIGNLSDKKIKIYANTNRTILLSSVTFTSGSKKIENIGSILNIPLTVKSNWIDTRGWQIYDNESKTKSDSGKDLLLHSYHRDKTKPFALITGGRSSDNRITNLILLHSIKFRNWYERLWGTQAYERWYEGIRTSVNP